MNWGHLFFSFSGRINRAKLWLWILLWVIVWVVAMILAFAIVYGTGMIAALFVIYAVVGIGSFISYLAVVVKRLHDRDKSGWWLLVFVVLPSVLVGASSGLTVMAIMTSGGDIPEPGPVSTIVYLIGAAIGLWAFVELFCLRGTVGPNKFGADPIEGRM